MEFANYITENSKNNLQQLVNSTNKSLHNNKILRKSFSNYKKFFEETNTKIFLRKVDMDTKANLKKKLFDFYKDLIDDKVNQNYDFIRDLESVNDVYEIYVSELEMFKFYVYYDDIKYISQIIHIFNIFTKYIFSVPEKKRKFFMRLFGHSNELQNKLNNIDKYYFNIYLFPNKLKRILAGISFTLDHLRIYKKTNTAFTTSGVTSFEMILTKKEEFSKLFLHELIHLYKLDGTHSIETGKLDNIRNMMPFMDYNGERECVAELMSNIYNCMNLCLISSDKSHDSYDQLIDLINIEKEYSIYLVAKILKYFNIKPNELFNYVKQKVQLVSPINLYCILRSILFFKLDDFLHTDNMANSDILEINDNIYSELVSWVDSASIVDSEYMLRLEYYYNIIQIKNNLAVLYISLDIDFDMVEFKNIHIEYAFNEMSHMDLFKKQFKEILLNKKNMVQYGGSKNFYYKYLKYKLKYLQIKK